jgi:hypothetical protein
MALRYDSVDYFSYMNIYSRITGFATIRDYYYSTGGFVEPGFALLIIIENRIFGNFYIFIIIFSLINCLIKYYIIKEMSPFLILSILLYFSDVYFWTDIGQIRNGMASALVLYSVFYAYKRKPFSFIFVILAATSIHYFAIIGVFIYLIPLIKRPQTFLWVSMMLVILINGLGLGALLFKAVAESQFIFVSSRLLGYINHPVYLKNNGLFRGIFIEYLFLSSFMLFFYKNLVKKLPINKVLIPMFILGFSFMLIMRDLDIFVDRIKGMLCVPSSIIIISSFILVFKKQERVFPIMAILAYCVMWFALNLKSTLFIDGPYESILQFLR